MNALPGYDAWLSAPYDAQPETIEPTDAQFDDAFDSLMQCHFEATDYPERELQSLWAIVQLYHKRGLPRMDKSACDDALRDAYENAFTGLIDGFRDVVTNNGLLAKRAEQVARDEIADAIYDAEAEREDY